MDDLEELIKEVFARFGAAYYHSEVLHRGLCNTYALMTFESPNDITRPRIEEKLARAYSLTLGQIVEGTRGLFPTELKQRLEIALEKRNYLAHHFWFERCHLMFSEQGLLDLRQELLELNDLFMELDEEVSKYFKPRREAFGITDELVQQSFGELMAGKLEEPLISQRPPKKQEHIIRVWDVKVTDNLLAQIFEAEDGSLWQFCDVGLGWTRFEKPAPDWKINETIQRLLPATVNPRPPVSEPWNYELRLAKGAVLWVKRGKRERSYTWGIKISSKNKST
jgi:hypothetical protein